MLKIAHISQIKIHTEEWRKARLAKFTSSMASTLMGPKFLNEKCVAYIYERVGEEMTGIPCKTEISTDATNHGLMYEGVALRKFAEFMGVEFLVTQCLITEPGSRFGSTPDGIWVKNKFGDSYDVETVEVKCYPSYPHFIECVLCETPADIKQVDSKLYWQVLDQMYSCDCMRGYAVLYHPDFKAGGFRIIQFKKIELSADFKELKNRKIMAEQKFNEFRAKLITLNPAPWKSSPSSLKEAS